MRPNDMFKKNLFRVFNFSQVMHMIVIDAPNALLFRVVCLAYFQGTAWHRFLQALLTLLELFVDLFLGCIRLFKKFFRQLVWVCRSRL